MTHCELKNSNARLAVAKVWQHLRRRHPDAARFLAGIVQRMVPLTKAEAADGTRGEWVQTQYPASLREANAFDDRFGGHGQGYGIIKLLDSAHLSVEDVAHELGHAFASMEDLIERKAPSDEWASEATADMHALRWGLMTMEHIRQRHEGNVRAWEATEATTGAAWAHHGPVPGGPWMEVNGERIRLNENFVFEQISS